MTVIAQLAYWIVVPLLLIWSAIRLRRRVARRRGRISIRHGPLLGFPIGALLVIAISLDGQASASSVAVTAIVFGLGTALLGTALLIIAKYRGQSKIEITW
jgi:hypothetical protein